MLTIGAIVRWEALLGKSFFVADYTNEDELLGFVYSLEPAPSVPFSVWRETGFSSSNIDATLSSLTAGLQVWGQYLASGEVVGSAGEGPSDEKVYVTVTDLVGDLIVSGGVSAKWAMEDMTLLELQALGRALERRQRYNLENDRLWTFFGVAPHLAGNKIKGPKDLFPFPWEDDLTRPLFSDEDRDERLRQFIAEQDG